MSDSDEAVLDDIDENMQTAIEVIRVRQEDQARRALAMGLSGVGAWSWTIKTDHLEWDAQMCNLFGVGLGDVKTYDDFLALVTPTDREIVQRAIDASLAGESYEIEYTIELPSGGKRVIYARGNRYPDVRDPEKLIGVCMRVKV